MMVSMILLNHDFDTSTKVECNDDTDNSFYVNKFQIKRSSMSVLNLITGNTKQKISLPREFSRRLCCSKKKVYLSHDLPINFGETKDRMMINMTLIIMMILISSVFMMLLIKK